MNRRPLWWDAAVQRAVYLYSLPGWTRRRISRRLRQVLPHLTARLARLIAMEGRDRDR
jgi:hypothetical protein